MAMKALLFLLAFVVLVSMRVSSVEEDFTTEYPAPAPEKLPVVFPPKKAPAPAPLLPGERLPRLPGCSGKCVKYCDGKGHQKRWCQKVCTVCCSQCRCVPEKETPCNNWDQVNYHGQLVKCP